MNTPVQEGLLLRKIALYVTKILRIFGLVFEKDFFSLGSGDVQSLDNEKILQPYLKSLAQFRANVRNGAIAKKDHSHFLQLSDELRDDIMPPLGVRLEDGGATLFKIDTPEVVIKEIAEQKQLAEKAKKKGIENKIRSIESELVQLDTGQLSPRKSFEQEGFKNFDADGIPITDKNGKEVSTKTKKKFQKVFQTQQKLHQKYKEKIEKDPDYIMKKKVELQELKEKLK